MKKEQITASYCYGIVSKVNEKEVNKEVGKIIEKALDYAEKGLYQVTAHIDRKIILGVKFEVEQKGFIVELHDKYLEIYFV